jgi:iron complex outermembrane receptor protein
MPLSRVGSTAFLFIEEQQMQIHCNRFFLLLASITTILSSPLFSQTTVTVTGTVYDAESINYLAGAELIIEELNRGTSSDEQGNFRFINVPEGKYTLSASFVGYRVAKQELITEGVKNITLSVMLLPIILKGQTIEVTATRARVGESPVTFSNLSRSDLEDNYTASDIPMMLNELPGVYAYSLTGDNLGYSFLKIRGFDQSRVGVMINEIPLNDPEDQQVYWVDHPDLSESVEDIQVQRGVGSSIYGTSTFGGSVNINTKNFSSRRSAKVTFGGGSFNTQKILSEYQSGMVQNTYGFYGRISRIKSDGYRRNSSSDLLAYFLGIERYDRHMITRLNIFNGQERTHPDWDGIPQNLLAVDRRYKKETYENAVDNFTQPQVHLINDWQINLNLNLTNTFYFIHGQGYYENLKQTENLIDFGMLPYETFDPGLFGSDSLSYYQTIGDSTLFRGTNGTYIIERTDLTRQKWVSKNQFGWIGKLTFAFDEATLTLGTAIYSFKSSHHGSVLWAQNMPSIYDPQRQYYKYNGDKNNISFYLNYLYSILPDTKILVNMLYEHKTYSFAQRETALFQGNFLNRYDVIYDFYSPRLGLNYDFNDKFRIYGNISYAQREPADNELFDIWSGPDDLGAAPLFAKNDTIKKDGETEYIMWQEPYVKPESVLDYEVGVSYQSKIFNATANLYYMDFRNEIVPLGTIDKDGNPIRGNADKTIHSGLEIAMNYTPFSFFKVAGNLAWSKNFYSQFFQENYDNHVDDLSGNTIAGFPDLIGNFRVSCTWKDLYSSLLVKYVGRQYLDNTQNANRILDPFSRVDFMLGFRLKNFYYFPEIRFTLNIINLLNEEYETAGYYDAWIQMGYYYPGAVRNYYFAVSLSL